MDKIKYEDDLSGYGIAADDKKATIISFKDRDAAEIHIPPVYNGVPIRKIGFGAFKGMENLRRVYLPEGIRIIESAAFRYCPLLETAVLSKELEQLANYSFANCPNLRSVTLPSSVRSISNKIFEKDYRMTELNIWDMNKNDGSMKRFVVASINETRRFSFLQSSFLYFEKYSMVKYDEGYSVIQEFEDMFNIAEYRLYNPEQLTEYMRMLYENNIRMFLPKLIREDQAERLASAGRLGLITEDKIDGYIEAASAVQGSCLAYLLDYKEKNFEKKHTLDFDL